MDRHHTRRAQLRKLVRGEGADAILITSFTNVTYLTGFTGDDSYLLLGSKDAIVVSDPRYTTQLEEECPDVTRHIRPPGKSMLDGIAEAVRAAKAMNLAVEADAMSVGLYGQLSARLSKTKLVSASGLVEQLRVVKDKHEIDEIRLAARYAEKAFAVLRATLRPDQTEKEIAAALEYQLRLMGARGCSFPPIIAVGARAALPHASPTDQKIGDADFVLVDWGATARQYKSDLTRVLVTGKISPKLERVYNVVLDAQLRAIDAVRPGLTGREVDQVARKIIADAGFGRQFGHGLGHGLGLDIHEAPRLAAAAEQVLKPGMVVTVEPGIYLPGWGGVRIEDDILVTKTGCEILTDVPKKLEEVVVQ
ncbi:MAG: aminopeptidase P family protein [Planctomycetia bacterium]|nr:aminopeptidase P family protein [Planctomycetia bacterium]